MKLKSYFPNKGYDVLFLCVYLILFIYAVFRVINVDLVNGWTDMCVQDHLFNFGGGFIRRGLGGEIIFFVQDYLHIPPLIFINLLSGLSYIALSYILIRLFLKRGYALNVLILSFALGGVLVYNFSLFRRDFLEVLLFGLIVILYKRMALKPWIAVGNLTMIFGILLHEATFFFSIPLLILITNLKLNSIIKSTAWWMPSIIAFLICCVFKGSPESLPALLDRAAAHAPEAFEDGNTPYLLGFIGNKASEAFRIHIMMNFVFPVRIFSLPIPSLVFAVFYYLYIPYLTIAMIMGFTKRKTGQGAMSNLLKVIVIQFVCLLPMWIVLSCDYGRVSFYWITSSLLVWLSLKDNEIPDMFTAKYNHLINNLFSKTFTRWLPSKPILTVLALCIGVVFCGQSLVGMFTSSLIHKLYIVVTQII